jgi:hypothetical protein
VNQTGLLRQRSRSSYWERFEKPEYGHALGLRKASLDRPEIPTATFGSTPRMRRTVTRRP